MLNPEKCEALIISGNTNKNMKNVPEMALNAMQWNETPVKIRESAYITIFKSIKFFKFKFNFKKKIYCFKELKIC